MIQRKQTLFLIVAFIISIVLLFVPFIIIAGDTHNEGLKLLSVFSGFVNTNLYYPFVLDIISIILSLLTIFLYKNRPLQYKISNFLALINVFLLGLFFILPYNVGFGEFFSYSIGAFLPIISIGCSFLAAHFIKKDEQLVRSANRIR